MYRVQKRNIWISGMIAASCLVFLFIQCMISVQWNTDEKKMQQELANEVLRFHVLANSDSEKDQEQKLRVRDAVIEVLKPVLEGAQDNLESKERIIKNMETIEHTAKKVAGEYPVTISMLKDYFPKITYGDFVFPAGEYEALRVEIGEAKGHNWWCLLYPGLCFTDICNPVLEEEGKEKLRMVLKEDTYEGLVCPDKIKIRFRWF